MKRAALLTLFAGMLTVISFGIMSLQSGGTLRPAAYPNPHGFTSAIIWFELADSADEIFANLGPADSDIGKDLRIRMNRLHKYDFIFMVCYTSLFASIFYYLYRAMRSTGAARVIDPVILFSMLVCAVAMLLGDALENKQLLALTGYSVVESVPDTIISSLKEWTTLKWGMIFFSCAVASIQYARYFTWRLPGIFFILLYALTSLIGFSALILNGYRHWIEYTNSMLAIAWMFSLGHAGVLYFSRKRKR